MAIPREKEHYTYEDYYSWDDDERWELIDGVPYAMSPAPSPRHQRVLGRLHAQLYDYLKGKSCEVFLAPFDVRLNADTYDDTVVQPDLLVVCDKSKLDDKGCVGAPDMVIEILSPSTARKDQIIKFNKYQAAGVREYWVVDTADNILRIHVLENGKYVTGMHGDTETVAVHVLDGCTVSLPDVFIEE